MVFQEGALFPWLKVQDNVEFGLKMAGIPKDEREQRFQTDILDMMQLDKICRFLHLSIIYWNETACSYSSCTCDGS